MPCSSPNFCLPLSNESLDSYGKCISNALKHYRIARDADLSAVRCTFNSHTVSLFECFAVSRFGLQMLRQRWYCNGWSFSPQVVLGPHSTGAATPCHPPPLLCAMGGFTFGVEEGGLIQLPLSKCLLM